MKRKNGFTLLEMMVVIGILGILLSILASGFMGAPKKAEKAKCQVLVSNVAAALTALFNDKGAWPQALVKNHNNPRGLDAEAAFPLARGSYLSLSYDAGSGRCTGYDRLGVVSPWALAVVKNLGDNASDSTPVPGGGTIADHRLRYALDLDGNGVIDQVALEGGSVPVRATAAVWCCGADGKIESYAVGQRKDDVYSWTYGQTQGIH